jgi:hypothetical protein
VACALLLAVATPVFSAGARPTAISVTARGAAYRQASPDGRWTATRQVPGLAALNAGGQASLTALSCAPAGNCAAGGSYTDAAGAVQAWLATGSGGTWRPATEVPGTAALNSGGSAAVTSVSCPAAGTCDAVGTYTESGWHPGTFAATESGGRWRAAIALGTSALAQAQASVISCAGAGTCVAAGNGIVTRAAGRWGSPAAIPGIAALAAAGGIITAISCPSAGDCAAAGHYPSGTAGQQVFVITERDGRWGRARQLPGIARLNTGNWGSVGGISCASAGDCAVGGMYEITGGGYYPFVADEVHEAWRAAIRLPGMAGVNGAITDVSCPAPGDCAAVGGALTPAAPGGTESNLVQSGLVTSEVDGTWQAARSVPEPASFGFHLSSVSCQAAGDCQAVGTSMTNAPVVSLSDSGGLTYGIAEGAGSWQPPGQLPGTLITDDSRVACARDGGCVAAGTYQVRVSYPTSPSPQSAWLATERRIHVPVM